MLMVLLMMITGEGDDGGGDTDADDRDGFIL